MAQLADAASDAPHVFVSAKSPVVATLAMLIAAEVLLVSVTACAGLVAPRPCDENVRLAGEIVTTGREPRPPPLPLSDELPPPHACSRTSIPTALARLPTASGRRQRTVRKSNGDITTISSSGGRPSGSRVARPDRGAEVPPPCMTRVRDAFVPVV